MQFKAGVSLCVIGSFPSGLFTECCQWVSVFKLSEDYSGTRSTDQRHSIQTIHVEYSNNSCSFFQVCLRLLGLGKVIMEKDSFEKWPGKKGEVSIKYTGGKFVGRI